MIIDINDLIKQLQNDTPNAKIDKIYTKEKNDESKTRVNVPQLLVDLVELTKK